MFTIRTLAKSAVLSVALAGGVGCALEAAPQAPQGTTTQEAIIPPMLPPKPLEAKPEGVQGKEAEKLEEAPMPHEKLPLTWEVKLTMIQGKEAEIEAVVKKMVATRNERKEAEKKAKTAQGEAAAKLNTLVKAKNTELENCNRQITALRNEIKVIKAKKD